MVNIYQKFMMLLHFIFCIAFSVKMNGQFTNIGSGSYTNTFPGTDAAGRNSFPSGSPQLSGNAAGKPVPTNDWWSALVKENHVKNLFNYPLAMRTVNQGLVVSYVVPGSTGNGSSEPLDDLLPITIGVTDLNAAQTTVSDYSDWTVDINWSNSSHSFTAKTGVGMPFIYFTKNSSDVTKIDVTQGMVTISNEMLIITDSRQGSDFAVYAPSGSTWEKNGHSYTSTLNGKNYWSVAFIPPTAADITTVANEYKKYAYVFPANTTTSWSYDNATSKMTTIFSVATDVKEGTNNNVLLGLLPHQWAHLAPTSPQPNGYSYSSIRGELKTLSGNTFTVENTFYGILPTLPYLDNYSNGFNPALMTSKISQIENDELAEWTDSYNEGQQMNRLIQTARIADEMGNTEARNKILATIKSRLEDWLKAEPGEVAFLYYYNKTWSSLLGYPAGHGQDSNINDHHFHWGYFIHAAAFVEQFEPGWAKQWGQMVNLLVRDAASSDRNDPLFPYLRNFSPYAGHSWANGFATFPFGNDQESSSESMQFASSLIHWGSITKNNAIRDLGIYIYTTEQTALEEYWFDQHKRTFKPGYGFSLASRIWGNGYDNQTFWTGDIAAAYGIEMYPIHGGSLYLGQNTSYVQTLWNEISAKTGILNNEANANLWHDVYWQYLSFIHPQDAINMYNSYPQRSLKFGISDAFTYHWLHAMNVLGTVNTAVTADYPIAASFVSNGVTTYAAHNYSNNPIVVKFSDGYTLNVPANTMKTSRDIDASGVLASDFYEAYSGGSVNLTATITGNNITKVEFYDGGVLIGSDTSLPYQTKAENLALGIHNMYAKIYMNEQFNVSNIISIKVGEQVPYTGTAFQIPGTIESGNYDKFEGGVGQNISYFDSTLDNQGDYRMSEYVDAVLDTKEGPTVGWITPGEWLEYSIDVQTSGFYNVTARYASGNTAGGGPFRLEIDGTAVSQDVALPTTNDWGNWADKTIANVPLTKGKHILRLVVTGGEFNLGRLNFIYADPLTYTPPIADAGENISVVIPNTKATLDGSASTGAGKLTYLWEQIYGPSIISFGSDAAVSTSISNLEKGVYKFKLTVDDGTRTSSDEVLVIVSETGNSSPSVSITSPANGASFAQGDNITIIATASDLDGNITSVKFYDGSTLLGDDTTAPYSFNWTSPGVGNHTITAVAKDNGNAETTSQAVNISVSSVASCETISNVAQQGSFSIGYKIKYQTIGNNVTITAELLDTDKVGVVAYLWKESPFGETSMDNVSGLTFSKTLNNQTPGETISYAIKFAFAGGLGVTKYVSYVVGSSCPSLQTQDTQIDDSVTIYPNPTSHILNVASKNSKITKVEVYSLSGNKLLETARTKINVENLPTGSYIVKIFYGNKTVTKKLIVQ